MKKVDQFIQTYINPKGIIDRTQFLLAINLVALLIVLSGSQRIIIFSCGVLKYFFPSWKDMYAEGSSIFNQLSPMINIVNTSAIFYFFCFLFLIVATIKYCRYLALSARETILWAIIAYLALGGMMLVVSLWGYYTIDTDKDSIYFLYMIAPVVFIASFIYFIVKNKESNKHNEKLQFLVMLLLINLGLDLILVLPILQMGPINDGATTTSGGLLGMLEWLNQSAKGTFLYKDILCLVIPFVNLALILPRVSKESYPLKKYVIPATVVYFVVQIMHSVALITAFYGSEASLFLMNALLNLMHTLFIVLIVTLFMSIEFDFKLKKSITNESQNA